MTKKITLCDLYKCTTNDDGSITISKEEKNRFEQNFQDYLDIRHAMKQNLFVHEMYNKLYIYSQWYNSL